MRRGAVQTAQAADHWKVVAASVRGLTHETMDRPCQDAHAWAVPTRGVLVAAVADGAGSAAHSEIGSAAAAQAAVNALCTGDLPNGPDLEGAWYENPVDVETMISEARRRWELPLTVAVEAANSAIQTEADVRGLPISDLSTTLALVVATPKVAIAMNVGDAYAVVGDLVGNVFKITVAPQYEYINQTDFLSHPRPAQAARGWLSPVPPKYIAMFTDGLGVVALKMPTAAPHGAFFKPLFQFIETAKDEQGREELEAFLRSPRVRAKADDDLTLLLACLE